MIGEADGQEREERKRMQGVLGVADGGLGLTRASWMRTQCRPDWLG